MHRREATVDAVPPVATRAVGATVETKVEAAKASEAAGIQGAGGTVTTVDKVGTLMVGKVGV